MGADVETATSEIAIVEVARAATIAGASADAVDNLLARCELVDLTTSLLHEAAQLASARLRTLDAIHLASALLIGPDELVAYDARLAETAREAGLKVVQPA